MAYGIPSVLGLDPRDPPELGPYRLAGRLGMGGMGTVFLAEGPQGPVAVKMINPHLARDQEFVARFRREVDAARRVRRFCTAPVLDARLDGEPLWLVTEYVAGPDLARVLKEGGPLGGSNVEALAVGVATALTAIHGAGVVHRDLKPGNVLLSPLGPRVIDFGIARALDTGIGQTATGRLMGTPEYMAPELVSGEKAGPPADIFAWGCVVVAAATGRSPFASKTVPEALYRVAHDTPSLDAVDPALRGTVEAALSKDPAARPTAEQLLTALTGRNHVDGADVAGTLRLDLSSVSGGAPAAQAAPPARRPEPARKGGEWRRLALAAVAGAAVVGLVTGGMALANALPASPPATTDVIYRDAFDNDESGWSNDIGGATSNRGYAGDGRYTMATDSVTRDRWAIAPVNAVVPEAVVVSAKVNVTQAGGTGWTGLFCEYSKDDEDKNDFFYSFYVRKQGQARIQKVGDGLISDLTADIEIPDYKAGSELRAVCARGEGEIRLALWAGDTPVADVADDKVQSATGRPAFGLVVSQHPSDQTATRAHFDDFTISRLG
ncbi:serine/threonine-protein kinase [Spongiactinospora sp. TRM90649]|uniref:serine/threonine-protein kinase n=1 Tax=Spongiactinospora sp. TRM90649 TaxID=3031114 RepID=UPI0023F7BDBB|nr:serine/threonine-protein kinase [Spongiactinospora sp. TRM90649]MDF5757865.1 serine/threonine-protein kinase [Spongiactinospora sp. TRM90649]